MKRILLIIILFIPIKIYSLTISGYVLDNSSAGVYGVNVYLTGAGVRQLYLTDISGHYTFTGNSNIIYKITTELQGYTFFPASVNFVSGVGNIVVTNIFSTVISSYPNAVIDSQARKDIAIIKATDTWQNTNMQITSTTLYAFDNDLRVSSPTWSNKVTKTGDTMSGTLRFYPDQYWTTPISIIGNNSPKVFMSGGNDGAAEIEFSRNYLDGAFQTHTWVSMAE